jgi:hypothetical protein
MLGLLSITFQDKTSGAAVDYYFFTLLHQYSLTNGDNKNRQVSCYGFLPDRLLWIESKVNRRFDEWGEL